MTALPPQKIDYRLLVPALLIGPLLANGLLAAPVLLFGDAVAGTIFGMAFLFAAFSLYFGLIAYLVLGVPLVLWKLTGRNTSPLRFAMLCGAANMLSPFVLYVWFGVITQNWSEGLSAVLYFWLFGFLFAPAWGLCAGLIYHALRHVFARLGARARPASGPSS